MPQVRRARSRRRWQEERISHPQAAGPGRFVHWVVVKGCATLKRRPDAQKPEVVGLPAAVAHKGM